MNEIIKNMKQEQRKRRTQFNIGDTVKSTRTDQRGPTVSVSDLQRLCRNRAEAPGYFHSKKTSSVGVESMTFIHTHVKE